MYSVYTEITLLRNIPGIHTSYYLIFLSIRGQKRICYCYYVLIITILKYNK